MDADHSAKANVLEMLDRQRPAIAAHGSAVARAAGRTCKVLGLAPSRRRQVELAARVHDIGKLSIPLETLDKPGPLDADEWAQMRLHPVLGEQILVSGGMSGIAPWVRSHHERPDGRGYPDGLHGDEIPLESRILAVADAFDAMVSPRPYSPSFSRLRARQEILAAAGTQFDREVAAAFLRAELGARARPSRFQATRPSIRVA